MLVREDIRRKCGEMVVVERENVKSGEERGDDNGMEKGMEVTEGREISEDGRGKGRKTVVIKENGRGMKESEMGRRK